MTHARLDGTIRAQSGSSQPDDLCQYRTSHSGSVQDGRVADHNQPERTAHRRVLRLVAQHSKLAPNPAC
eukprot:2992000-Rhodomonas_salina.4